MTARPRVATAATGAAVTASAEPVSPEPFVVDRPFLCAVRDERTGVLLFVGLIYHPNEV